MKCRKQFGQNISEVSSVQPGQTNGRTTNVFIDRSVHFRLSCV